MSNNAWPHSPISDYNIIILSKHFKYISSYAEKIMQTHYNGHHSYSRMDLDFRILYRCTQLNCYCDGLTNKNISYYTHTYAQVTQAKLIIMGFIAFSIVRPDSQWYHCPCCQCCSPAFSHCPHQCLPAEVPAVSMRLHIIVICTAI